MKPVHLKIELLKSMSSQASLNSFFHLAILPTQSFFQNKKSNVVKLHIMDSTGLTRYFNQVNKID